jgi:hypothetical protein
MVNSFCPIAAPGVIHRMHNDVGALEPEIAVFGEDF